MGGQIQGLCTVHRAEEMKLPPWDYQFNGRSAVGEKRGQMDRALQRRGNKLGNVGSFFFCLLPSQGSLQCSRVRMWTGVPELGLPRGDQRLRSQVRYTKRARARAQQHLSYIDMADNQTGGRGYGLAGITGLWGRVKMGSRHRMTREL